MIGALAAGVVAKVAASRSSCCVLLYALRMSDQERVETTVDLFTDEATGKPMARIRRTRYVWVEGISRYHGDDTGYTGWSEWSHEDEIVEASDPRVQAARRGG